MKLIIPFLFPGLILTLAIFFAEKSWIMSIIKNPTALGVSLVTGGVLFFILYLFTRGFFIIWPVVRETYSISSLEIIILIISGVIISLLSIKSGFIVNEVSTGLTAILTLLTFFALFWMWRMIKNIINRILHGDSQYHLTNSEYFTILSISAFVSVLLIMVNPAMFHGDKLNLKVLIVFLLFISASICFYWIYKILKILFREFKYRDVPFDLNENELIINSYIRTFKIPWDSIIVQNDGDEGEREDVFPSVHAPKNNQKLVISSSIRKAPFVIVSSDKEMIKRIRDKAAMHGKQKSFKNE